MIDLKRLRHLSTLVQHGNFHRAAEALHLTQPALTRSIQALEAHVGAPLLTRHRTGVEPTELGRLLLRHAGTLEGQVRDLDRELRLAKGLALGELRVGVGPWGGSVLVGPVVGRLNALHPGLQLKLVLAPWRELPERARARARRGGECGEDGLGDRLVVAVPVGVGGDFDGLGGFAGVHLLPAGNVEQAAW